MTDSVDIERLRGYKTKDVYPAMVVTLWVLFSLGIFMAGLIGLLIGRLGS